MRKKSSASGASAFARRYCSIIGEVLPLSVAAGARGGRASGREGSAVRTGGGTVGTLGTAGPGSGSGPKSDACPGAAFMRGGF